MSSTVKLIYEGKEYEFPIVESSLGDKGIDISRLRGDTGLITFDSGFKNTASTKSNITFLDGEDGILYYRGYPIEQIAAKSDFVEVMFLLLEGHLPTQTELDKFNSDIRRNNLVSEEMKQILEGFPRSAHPMGVLSALTSSLTAFNPIPVNVKSEEKLRRAGIVLISKFPVLAAWTYRRMFGMPLNYADNSLDYVSNFYQMVFRKPTEELEMHPVIIDALNKLLVLHADHEQNCSTSTVRMVGSAQTGLFGSISAGVSALWGPLHGGANQSVIEMLEMIKNDGGNLQKWVDKAKDKNDDFRLMGFGHRVYRNFDPRGKIIKKVADDVFKKLHIEDDILDLAKKLEEVALHDQYFIDKKLYPNVDFYSGIIYRALGIPTPMFTVMFALGRLPGWISQWKEMRLNKEPIGRPRQIYQGEARREYVDIKDRK